MDIFDKTLTTANDSLNAAAMEPVNASSEQSIQPSNGAQTPIDADSASDDVRKKARLHELVARVKKSVNDGRTIGKELKEINDLKLYKMKGYRSFHKFCQDTFEITGTHAFRMIHHYETCVILKQDCSKIAEKTTRPLSYLTNATDEDKIFIWGKAVEASDTKLPTACAVRNAVSEYKRSHCEPEDNDGKMYVKGLRQRVERERMVEAMISGTKSLKDLLMACEPFVKELHNDERKQLLNECRDRLNSVFAGTVA